MDPVLLNILIPLGIVGVLFAVWGIVRLGNHILDWANWKAYQERERERIEIERPLGLYFPKEAYDTVREPGLDFFPKKNTGREAGPIPRSETIPIANNELPGWSIKVLDVVRSNPDAMFTSRQIAMQTGLSRKRAWEILDYLAEQGVLRRDTAKRPHVFSLNRAAPSPN